MPLIMLPEGTTNAQIPQLQPHELKGPSGMAAKQQLLYKIVNYQHRAYSSSKKSFGMKNESIPAATSAVNNICLGQ